jgi:hypothetical protein
MKKKFFGAAWGVYIFNGGTDISTCSIITPARIENASGSAFFAQTLQGVCI